MLDALRRRVVDRGARGRPFVRAIVAERHHEGSRLDCDAGRRLLEQPDEVVVSALFAALDLAKPRNNVWDGETAAAGLVASELARRKLAYTRDDVEELIRRALDDDSWLRIDRIRVAVSAADFFAREHGVRELERPLRKVLAWASKDQDGLYASERTALSKRVRKLLETEPPRELDASLLGSDAWGKRALRALEPRRHDPAVAALVAHAAGATQSRPSKKWRAAAAEVADEEIVRALLEEATRAEDGPVRWGVPQWVSDKSATTLRGLVYTAAAAGYPWLPELAGRLGAHAAATVGTVGEVRNMKVANACIRALGDVGGDEAAEQLSLLRSRLKHRALLKQIDAALGDAAAAAGVTKGQLLERQVPTFELDADGRREVQLGDATAILEYGELTWRDTKTVPKRVREEHAAELRELRAQAKEIKKRLAVERVRVESLFAEARRWPLDDWRSHYRDHPLVGGIARPLLWRFLDGGRSDVALGADAPDWAEEVELWHPIGAEPEEVQRWRRFLLERELTQPFKQAFREVYEIAPAELETRTYSNRFAAHILRYPQAYALIKQRGWGVTALGPYDNDGGRQWRDFEHFGIRAHFWMDHTGDEAADMIDAFAATDQVRFTQIGDDEPLPLVDVPRIVFSETMRDVDLFVGVSSIAGDPEWVDRGEERYIDYWREASFGELAGTAQTRREVLEELLPQLAIADRCSLTDRFLVVRGDLRTYKIHLGSANILMEPNDQYLCIVPAARREKLYLPFPEDERLAVILSKAFLLARDTKIRDATITQQIRR